MTNQELFDIVVAHARKQKVRAVDNGVCKYRTPEGHKCFAGAVIKDEFYDKSFEGLGAAVPAVARALEASGVDSDQLDLVYKLQTIHDRNYEPQWDFEFSKLATEEGLTYENNLA